MKVNIVEKLNIAKPKQQDFEGYSATELMFTLDGVLNELSQRGKRLDNALSIIDANVSKQTHEIELVETYSTSEKVNRHDNLMNTLQERRKLKQERVIINRVNNMLDSSKLHVQVLNYLHCLAGTNKSYNHDKNKLNREIPVYKKGELKRLFNKYK